MTERRGHGTVGTTEKKKRFLGVYRDRKTCNITKACEAAAVGRTTFYRWMKGEKFREAVEAINESVIDWAEEKLRTRIDKEDITAIIFFLKTIGKRRGYIEKQEIEHSGELEHAVFIMPRPGNKEKK